MQHSVTPSALHELIRRLVLCLDMASCVERLEEYTSVPAPAWLTFFHAGLPRSERRPALRTRARSPPMTITSDACLRPAAHPASSPADFER